MPKVTKKTGGKGRGRGRGAGRGAAARSSSRDGGIDTDTESLAPSEAPDEAEVDVDVDPLQQEEEPSRPSQGPTTSHGTPTPAESQVEFSVELEEQIAAFFEARPYFYDLTSSNYKNKSKRNSELQEFAASIGWDGEYHK